MQNDSAFDDLVFEESPTVAKPIVAPAPRKNPAHDLELDLFDVSTPTITATPAAPSDNSAARSNEVPFDAQVLSDSNAPVDMNSYFTNEPRGAISPFESNNDTIAIQAVSDDSDFEEENDPNQPYIFTNVNGETVRGKKKPVNPKHKKSFLDNLFNK